MPINFNCPHCNHKTLVADEFAGRSGPCAGCGRHVTVPHPAYMEQVGPQPIPRRSIKGSSVALILSVVLFGVIAIGAVFLWIWDYASSQMSSGGQRASTACQENINQIVAALHAYEREHGHFPPTYTVDPNTQQPLHSWRVLILPYLGPAEEQLYSKIDLSKSWDSAENRPFQTLMPDIYHCPSHSHTTGAFTHYVAVEGSGHLFDGNKTVKAVDIADDPRDTIAVVEVANSNFNWMAPIDLHDSAAGYQIGSDPAAISSLHGEDAVNVGFLEGPAQQLSGRDVSESRMRAKMSIAGGD